MGWMACPMSMEPAAGGDPVMPSTPEEYLEELNKPMSFIGASLKRTAMLDGEAVPLLDVVNGRWEPANALHALRRRLMMIKASLSEGYGLQGSALESLFIEGQAIRRAIYMMTGKGPHAGTDRVEDLRRWIDYGRRIG